MAEWHGGFEPSTDAHLSLLCKQLESNLERNYPDYRCQVFWQSEPAVLTVHHRPAGERVIYAAVSVPAAAVKVYLDSGTISNPALSELLVTLANGAESKQQPSIDQEVDEWLRLSEATF